MIVRNEIEKNMKLITNNLEEVIKYIEYELDMSDNEKLDEKYRDVFNVKQILSDNLKSNLRYALDRGTKHANLKSYINTISKESKLVADIFERFANVVIDDLETCTHSIDNTIDFYANDLFLLLDNDQSLYKYFMYEYKTIN